MSDLSVNSILDASGGATTTINGFTPTVSNMAGRNRIINGDMRIDQRNAGAATANTISGYTVDRWSALQSTTGKIIAQQNAGAVTPPVGHVNYLGITSQSAFSIGAGDYYFLQQPVEGLNIGDLAWGGASAKAITISFQVYSSLTGTFGGALANAARNRSYPFTYTISVANTWTSINITIAGDTTGTWLTTNGVGMHLQIGLGVGATYSGTAGAWSANGYNSATGATSVVGTSGATFYITGVQLEEGSVATPFEHRQYGQELALCQRYYQKLIEPALSGFAPGSANVWRMGGLLAVQMRAAGTVTLTGSPPVLGTGSSSLTGVSTNYSDNGNSIEFDGTLNATATNTGGIIKTICNASTTAINISAEL